MGMKDRTRYEYWRISAGAIRKTTDKNDPEAQMRVVEMKDGSKQEVWEIVKGAVEGAVEGVSLVDGKFGRQLIIDISDGIESYKIQLPWESSYTRTFLERLPNVNLVEEIEIIPYSFKDDKGKKRSGVTVYQDGVKLNSAVREFDADGKFTGWVDGYPHFTDDMDKDDFKIVGAKQMKWLKENIVDPYPFNFKEQEAKETPAPEKGKERPAPEKGDDLPF